VFRKIGVEKNKIGVEKKRRLEKTVFRKIGV
jgi:hypothetical protein